MPATPKLTVIPPTDEVTAEPQSEFFWIFKRNEWHINRERLQRVSADHGYRWNNDRLYQIVDKFIHERDLRYYYDDMKRLIDNEDKSVHEPIKSSYEQFMQKNGAYTASRLPDLDESLIMHDTRTVCYKFYSDCFITITADKLTKSPYELLTGMIFANRIQQRPFRAGTTGKYLEFLQLACNLDKNLEYIQRIIGYYAHEYNSEEMGYFVMLTEQCADPKDGGGSGKNLFTQLLKYTTTLCDKAGSQTKFDDTTFQTWAGERIFSISDLPKDFDLSFFKNISTGGIMFKRLYSNQVSIPISKSPKLLFNTNFSYQCSDGGLKRRIVPLEFTDYFTANKGVDTVFGCHFPNGWNDDDWAGYDRFIIKSIQVWLQSGCKLIGQELSESGWHKQFEFSYGKNATDFIRLYWHTWLQVGNVFNTLFKTQFDTFCVDNSIPSHMKPSTRTLNGAIKELCNHCGVDFDADKQKKNQAGINEKYRSFLKKPSFITPDWLGDTSDAEPELPF